MQTKIEQNIMEWIALCFGCLLGQVGFFPADWDMGDPEPDLVVGTHNDWWLKRNLETGRDLVLTMRHENWLKNNAPLRGETSRISIALRMEQLRKQVKQIAGIDVILPFTHKEIEEAIVIENRQLSRR